ncbi:MAG: hypothetical protein CK527_02650 [Nitrosarchaeum sp.]|nr:MAG: hypothetical protein CK527_02650 [Nitrosarchaeum sp.]
MPCSSVNRYYTKSKSDVDNPLLQWTAIIALIITAVGAITAAKFRKSYLIFTCDFSKFLVNFDV